MPTEEQCWNEFWDKIAVIYATLTPEQQARGIAKAAAYRAEALDAA